MDSLIIIGGFALFLGIAWLVDMHELRARERKVRKILRIME